MQSLEVISVNVWQILISFLNLTILFLIVKKFLFKPVNNMLAKRQSELDEKYNDFIDYSANYPCLEILKNKKGSAEEFCRGLYNIFESVVEEQRPAVTRIKGVMLEYGAKGALMSGSGTSVFGIFENEEDAEKCAFRLKEQGATAHVCFPYIP